VTQLLEIFAFISVLLRGMTLAFEALTIGGVIFLVVIARMDASEVSAERLSRFLMVASTLLIATQIVFVGLNSVILMGSAGLTWAEVRGAGFCVAGSFTVVGAAFVGGFVRTRWGKLVCPAGCILILCGAVMNSHSIARLEHRGVLAGLTLAHHIASAAWIGALPYLLLTLRETPSREVAGRIVSRFSVMAMISVAGLVGAGGFMALLYVGSLSALTGTTYGVMLSSKVTLTALLVLLGALNRRIVRAVRAGTPANLLPLRRFGEAEVGIGFTVILAAASLTSTPPAMDVMEGRIAIPTIAERVKPEWPRMRTPALRELSPATPLSTPFTAPVYGSFVPGQVAQPNTPADIAWSEYNHHWAGMVVLVAGVLSLVARRISWARHWPLVFLGLAVFLFVRADSENWPLGPRGFWESFQVAEVAQHRLFVVLIVAFGMFEWAVRTGRISAKRGGLVFPLVCAVGGALLLTHSHSLRNTKEEFLAELSHAPLAILAVIAGWSRWLEVRLWPDLGQFRGIVSWIWPACFILIGAILLNYREA
jgi:putative copper resistance protein D